MMFTTIIVSRNASKTIAATLDSILAQEYGDTEVIVMDGASTDGTTDILKRYEAPFRGRLHWFSEPDRGIYDAMNKGIAKATGAFVNFLNCGDTYTPQALARIQKAMECTPEAEVVYGVSRYFDEKGEVRLIRENHTRFRERNICHQSIWYRRELFDKYGLYNLDYRFLADYEFNIRLFLAGTRFHPIDDIVVNYALTGVTSDETHTIDGQKEAMTIFYHHNLVDKAHYDWFMGNFTRRKLLGKFRAFGRSCYLLCKKIFK